MDEDQYQYEDEYGDQSPTTFSRITSTFIQLLPAIRNGIYNFFYYLSRYWK